jgi:hypothetical protein
LQKYHQSLAFVNKILNFKSGYRTDVQALARIFVLIVQYELKKEDLLPYLAKASERWLVKNKYAPKNFDKTLLGFFKYKLPKITSAKEELKALEVLLIQLKKIQNTEYSILKKEFDLESWLESKIQNCLMLEILTKKKSRTQSKRF